MDNGFTYIQFLVVYAAIKDSCDWFVDNYEVARK